VRVGAIILACLVWAGAANAGPITLLCTGRLVVDFKESKLDRETAILDLENRSFKPPVYAALPLTRISESDVSFGNEASDLSIQGSLDRVSGTLSMNVLRPNERKKLDTGQGAVFLAWIDAKCVPAQRMF
jgi:hypothetical protein